MTHVVCTVDEAGEVCCLVGGQRFNLSQQCEQVINRPCVTVLLRQLV